MAYTVIPAPFHQFFDNNGAPAAGYKLFVYQAGTSTKATIYTDADPVFAQPYSNPTALDASGRTVNGIFIPAGTYKFVLAPPDDTDPPSAPIWTIDGVQSVPEGVGTVDLLGQPEAMASPSRGAVVYMSTGADGRTAGTWYEADNTSWLMSVPPLIGIVTRLVTSSTCDIRLAGAATDGLPPLTPGATYYVGTGGALTSTAPAANRRAVGVAVAADKLVMPATPYDGRALHCFAFSSGQANLAGGADTQLTSYNVTIPANYLSGAGDGVMVDGTLSVANNANAKTAKLQVASGTTVTIWSSSAAVAGHLVPFRVLIRRRTSTTGSLTGLSYTGAAAAGAPTNYLANAALTSVDWTVSQTLKVYTAGNGAADVTLTDYSVWPIRGLANSTV